MTVIMFDYNYSDKYKREHKFEFYDGPGIESPALRDPLIDEYEKKYLGRTRPIIDWLNDSEKDIEEKLRQYNDDISENEDENEDEEKTPDYISISLGDEEYNRDCLEAIKKSLENGSPFFYNAPEYIQDSMLSREVNREVEGIMTAFEIGKISEEKAKEILKDILDEESYRDAVEYIDNIK